MKKLCLLSVYVLYGLLVFSSASRDCVSTVCEPAEEGTRHTITFALSFESNASIHITTDDMLAGTCYVNMSCLNAFPGYYNISRSQSKTFEIVEVTIYNVTKKNSETNKVWLMAKPSHSSYTKTCECLLPVFTRATDSACSKLISDDGMNFTCFTNKIYPRAICQLLLRINNTIIDTPYEILYKTLLSSAKYFASNCTIIVPKTNLSPGVYAIEVTIYPNVTNTDTDVKYGRNVSLSFTLERPRVLISQCPMVVDERSNVTCHCTEANSQPVGVDLRWYDLENKPLTTSNVMNFIVDRRQSGFYCQAKNSFAWRSEKVFYNISVLYLDFARMTVDGKQVKNNIVLTSNSSFVVLCESMGNPDPQVKLYNSQILIAQAMKSVNFTNTSTCSSPSVFTCSAVQENKQSSASVKLYTQCPLRFRSTEKHPETAKVNCKIHKKIRIILEIYGYPKPIGYYIVKNDAIMTRFHNVSEGNARENGDLIEYNENGTLTLTLKCPSENERSLYVFNLDNGISPALNYSFYVEEDILSNNQSTHVNSLLAITGTASLLAFISIVIAISCFCTRKVPCRPTEPHDDVSTGINEEMVHDDIQLRDARQFPGLNTVDGHRLGDTPEGMRHYDVVDYSLIEDGDQFYIDGTTVRSNLYDVLDNDSMLDHHEYNEVAGAERSGLDANEYITVIDEPLASDDC